jgi:hypothetical protein
MTTAKKRRPVGVSAAAVPLGPDEGVGAAARVVVGVAGKPLKAHQCRNHLRKTVAVAYRDIVAGFVEEAKSGSCQHLRMATEIVESKKRVKRSTRVKGPAAELLEDLGTEFLD